MTENKTKNTGAQTLIDRKKLASRWECSIMTIKRREVDGMLTPVNLMGRIVRYRLSDIEAIENGEDAAA
jgi:hypothetical protein